MKVRDTMKIDKIFYTLDHKILNFIYDHKVRHTGTWESMQYIKKNFPSWQYTGAAPFDDVLDWCEQHFSNDFVWNFETIYFKHERDRTAFLLRWT